MTTMITRIGTKEREIAKKRDEVAPRSLGEYMKNLEQMEIVRPSNSRWRTPMRATEKLDWGMRLMTI
jgi:hypothetical protein